MRSWLQTALVAVGLLIVVPAAYGQERPQDRKRFIDPDVALSDDPRWVPVSPVPRGPEGTMVLRGGRIFDGSGAPARSATLVIERNKIKEILPASSTAWFVSTRWGVTRARIYWWTRTAFPTST